ncbi:MAG TPA: anti-sigma factor [Acidimicrobiales bacterium]|nr:anti-sigma factor [Acidimicrobiales bacterium]
MSGQEGEVPHQLSHAELEALLGSYALDAVDGPEAEAVELHLLECPRCRAEVAEHREVAALLGNVGAPAPDRLWDRIAASLEEAPPDLPLAPASGPSRRPRAIPRRLVLVAGAAAAAAAVVIGVLAFQVHRLDNRVNNLAQSTPEHGLSQVATAAVLDPQARRVDLRSAQGNQSVQGVVLPNGHGYLVDVNLRPLSSRLTYQLWAISGTRQISLGVLGANPQEAAFSLSSPTTATTLAVTIEVSGGVGSTQNPAVVQGTLS